MIFEYEKPAVEIISFVTFEHLARAEREARENGNTVGDDNVTIGSMPEMSEGVEEWP